MQMYKHALAIGTTGMLARATHTLALQSQQLSCIARTEASLQKLEASLENNHAIFHAHSVDYGKPDAFMRAIETAWQRAPFDVMLVWMHREGHASWQALKDFLLEHFLPEKGRSLELFHVLSSATADPSKPASAAEFPSSSPIAYYPIILGFQRTANASRWLTHEEISQGTLEAMQAKQPRFVVGTVTPWSARP